MNLEEEMSTLGTEYDGHVIDHPLYYRWVEMKSRCRHVNNKGYKNYGALGIRVCERWRSNFASFVADVGMPEGDKNTIDRINVLGGYDCGKCADCVSRNAPSNCRWADQLTQQRNRRDSLTFEHNGDRLNATQLAELSTIKRSTIQRRLERGWSVYDAISIPVIRSYVASPSPRIVRNRGEQT